MNGVAKGRGYERTENTQFTDTHISHSAKADCILLLIGDARRFMHGLKSFNWVCNEMIFEIEFLYIPMCSVCACVYATERCKNVHPHWSEFNEYLWINWWVIQLSVGAMLIRNFSTIFYVKKIDGDRKSFTWLKILICQSERHLANLSSVWLLIKSMQINILSTNIGVCM